MQVCLTKFLAKMSDVHVNCIYYKFEIIVDSLRLLSLMASQYPFDPSFTVISVITVS